MEEYDDSEGIIEVGRSRREYIYTCCGKHDGSNDYCPVWQHVIHGSVSVKTSKQTNAGRKVASNGDLFGKSD